MVLMLWLRERLNELKEARRNLELERDQLERELARDRAGGGRAQARARDIQRHIEEDDGGCLDFARVSQNIATTAASHGTIKVAAVAARSVARVTWPASRTAARYA